MSRPAGPMSRLLRMAFRAWPWLLLLPALAAAQASPDLGWLGISIADVGEELADRLAVTFGPAAGNGVHVMDVLEDGPADRARLTRGDVIVQLDTQPVWDVRQLQRLIRSLPVNRRVTVTVLRGAARLRLPVVVGAMPAPVRAQFAGERFGFIVRELNERNESAGLGRGEVRLAVAFVEPESPAARSGLRPRDLLLEADRHPVHDLATFEAAVRGSDRTLGLIVARRGAPEPLSLTLELPRP
jgi:serine protease Do